MVWYKINFRNNSDLSLDDIGAELIELGASATEIKTDSSIDAYFEDLNLEKITECAKRLNLEYSEPEEIEQKNWAQECKEFFQALQIKEITITPVLAIEDAESLSPHEKEVLHIPGMGFGSGHHPTTAMMIDLMQSVILDTQVKRILDLGTGSGILSTAAKKLLPAADIISIDNDPQAVLNARDNFTINKLEQRNLSTQPIDEIAGDFDLILANIYLSVLKELQPEILKRLKSKGKLILSGITCEQKEDLLESYSNIHLIEEMTSDGWLAFSFAK